MKRLTQHWDDIFQKTNEEQLGWFENDFSQTLKFLNKIPDWQNSRIFVPGVGTSGLIDLLINSNAKLLLNDISPKALEITRNKYQQAKNSTQWICQDVSKNLPLESGSIDIWIDRAVLHFLIDDDDIRGYFRNVKKVVKPEGYALFAEFSKTGATKCAGLDVKRYSVQDLSKNLPGSDLVATEEHTYKNPNGDDRPYIYALFKNKKG
jgi:SAM-dependent methyltransferase